MTDKIVVGIIGAGANTRLRHIPELLSRDGVTIKTVVNRTHGSAQAVCQEFGIPVATSNWHEVMDDPEINAVVIGTWPYMHAQLSIAALDAGKHVLCEARMAMNASEAHAMLAASRRHPNLIAQIVPSPITLAFDTTIQDIVRSKKLGTLTVIRVKGVSGDFPDEDQSPLTWRQNVRASGLNVLTMGIAYEALTRWVGGASKVMAMGKTVVKTRLNPETEAVVAVHVPDHVDVLAEMSCGAQAHLVFSAVCGADPGPKHEFWLHGTEGTLHLDVDDGKLEIALRDQGGMLTEIDIAHSKRGHWRVEEEFIHAIRGEETVRFTDFETGVEYMEFTEAVARSMQNGQAVSLPLLRL